MHPLLTPRCQIQNDHNRFKVLEVAGGCAGLGGRCSLGSSAKRSWHAAARDSISKGLYRAVYK